MILHFIKEKMLSNNLYSISKHKQDIPEEESNRAK